MLRVGSKVVVMEDSIVKEHTFTKGEILKVIKVAKYNNNITLLKENDNKRYKITKNILLSKFSIIE